MSRPLPLPELERLLRENASIGDGAAEDRPLLAAAEGTGTQRTASQPGTGS